MNFIFFEIFLPTTEFIQEGKPKNNKIIQFFGLNKGAENECQIIVTQTFITI